MMRLIDAEKLWLTTEYVDGKVHKYYEQFEVDDAPTIDAEPVRHGRWELIGGYRYIGGYGCQYRCSNCIKCADHRTNYCPNCGAKMDEVNDEVN